MTTKANKRLRRAFVFLVVFGMIFNVAVLLLFVQVRSDVCTFAIHVSASAHQLPQVKGRVGAEQAYSALESNLRCG